MFSHTDRGIHERAHQFGRTKCEMKTIRCRKDGGKAVIVKKISAAIAQKHYLDRGNETRIHLSG